MQDLLGDGGHQPAAAVQNPVVPLHELPLHIPAVAVQGELGTEEGKFLSDAAHISIAQINLKLGQQGQHLLLQGGDGVAHGVVDLQVVPEGELALHGVDGSASLVIDVIAVEPGKKALFKEQFHG